MQDSKVRAIIKKKFEPHDKSRNRRKRVLCRSRKQSHVFFSSQIRLSEQLRVSSHAWFALQQTWGKFLHASPALPLVGSTVSSLFCSRLYGGEHFLCVRRHACLYSTYLKRDALPSRWKVQLVDSTKKSDFVQLTQRSPDLLISVLCNYVRFSKLRFDLF